MSHQSEGRISPASSLLPRKEVGYSPRLQAGETAVEAASSALTLGGEGGACPTIMGGGAPLHLPSQKARFPVFHSLGLCGCDMQVVS